MKISELSENEKPKAQWKKDKGPEDIGGFSLYVERDRVHGDGKYWSFVGFSKEKPKSNTGSVSLYDGRKDVNVNLNDYNIED